MLIDGPAGIKMEEFTCGEYMHRFVVDMDAPFEQREFRREREAENFEGYMENHKLGLIKV